MRRVRAGDAVSDAGSTGAARRIAAILATVALAIGLAGGIWLASSTGGPEATSDATPAAAPASAPPADAASPPPVARSDFGIAQQPAAQDAPVAVAVAAVGIDLAVVPVGVRADGQMAIPARVTEVGWYAFGPAPGAAQGSAVLSAHVDSELGRAPMAALLDVEPGAIVEITTTSGAVLAFRVERVEQLGKQQLPLDELFARDGPPLLRLVTCAGAWDPVAGAYEDNLVVTAIPVAP